MTEAIASCIFFHCILLFRGYFLHVLTSVLPSIFFCPFSFLHSLITNYWDKIMLLCLIHMAMTEAIASCIFFHCILLFIGYFLHVLTSVLPSIFFCPFSFLHSLITNYWDKIMLLCIIHMAMPEAIDSCIFFHCILLFIGYFLHVLTSVLPSIFFCPFSFLHSLITNYWDKIMLLCLIHMAMTEAIASCIFFHCILLFIGYFLHVLTSVLPSIFFCPFSFLHSLITNYWDKIMLLCLIHMAMTEAIASCIFFHCILLFVGYFLHVLTSVLPSIFFCPFSFLHSLITNYWD